MADCSPQKQLKPSLIFRLSFLWDCAGMAMVAPECEYSFRAPDIFLLLFRFTSERNERIAIQKASSQWQNCDDFWLRGECDKKLKSCAIFSMFECQVNDTCAVRPQPHTRIE